MCFQELAGIVLALTDAVITVAVPGPCLVNDVVLHAEIDQLAETRNALP